MVPGFAIEVKVFFKPDEYKYYTDSIKILSEVKHFKYKSMNVF